MTRLHQGSFGWSLFGVHLFFLPGFFLFCEAATYFCTDLTHCHRQSAHGTKYTPTICNLDPRTHLGIAESARGTHASVHDSVRQSVLFACLLEPLFAKRKTARTPSEGLIGIPIPLRMALRTTRRAGCKRIGWLQLDRNNAERDQLLYEDAYTSKQKKKFTH